MPEHVQLAGDTRLHGLDHLRSLAILLVFIFHYGVIFPSPPWVATVGKFGWTGVDLFFVLSGYLISSQLFSVMARKESIPFKDFFIKRLFRIVPAYLVVLAIYFLVPGANEQQTLAPFWKYLTFTQNLGLDLRSQRGFSHAWSLCIEEQFYLLLPLVLALLMFLRIQKKSAWLLLFVFIGGILLRWYLFNTKVVETPDAPAWVNWYKWIYYPTFTRLDGLLTGITIAAAFQFRPALKKRVLAYGNYLLVLALLILSVAYVICSNEESFLATVLGFPLVSLGYGCLLIAAISPNTFLYRVPLAITARIAALSYAIYLTHKIVIHSTQTFLTVMHVRTNGNWAMLICIITCIAAAVLLHLVVEKPFLRWRKRLLTA